MKRFLLAICLLVLVCTSVFASMVPFNDPYFDKDSVFSSPARLIESAGVTHFGFEVEAMSAFDYLSYITDPSAELRAASDDLYDMLMNGDETFWEDYYGYLDDIFSFDNSSNLPARPTDAISLAAMRAYLQDSYSNRFSDEQKGLAVLNAEKNTDLFDRYSHDELYSDAVLRLSLFGGVVYENGFGWDLGFNAGLTMPEDMLSSGRSLMAFDLYGDVGYAFHVFSERFTVGASLGLNMSFQTNMSNSTMLLSRYNASSIDVFMDDDYRLGLGFSLDFGTMYRHNEELAFTFDLVNVATFRTYYDLAPTDFVDYDGFDNDGNTYYQPLDFIIRALWDRGPYHVRVEFGDVINQVIWMNELPSYSFDFFMVPKVYFDYDLTQDLTLKTGLEYLRLLVGVEWQGLEAELAVMLDKPGLGLTVGWSF